jgi:outer membrane protein OmpA-like peptidoglycan-associated protein
MAGFVAGSRVQEASMLRLRVPLLASVLLGVPLQAWAVDADTFEASGSSFDGRGTIQLHHPDLGFQRSLYAGMGLSWADDPIVVQHSDGSEEPLVHSLFGTRIAGGYNIAGRVRVDLSMPLYPYAGAPDAGWSGFSAGDLGVGALISLKQVEAGSPGFAVHTGLQLPTGGEYTGQPGTRFDLAAAAAGRSGAIGWTANLGLGLTKAEELGDISLGSSIDPGLGLHYVLNDSLLLGTELTSTLTLAGGLGPFNKNPTEGHLYAQYASDGGLVVSGGAGTGLVAGVGAPDLRLFVNLGYHSKGVPPVFDQDADGILDDVDACPLEAEDPDGFDDEDGCPDPDNDQDTIPDERDQCPRQAEDLDSFKDLDGCPDPDNDGDRVLDTEDDCPNEAGTLETRGCPDADGDQVLDSLDNCVNEPGPATTRGCPDADGDRIPDKRDACPDEPADPRADPDRSDGCPKRVVVTMNKIEILEKIHFETGKARIRKDSFGLLDEIAQVLSDNPDIKLVEVAGHTDNQGSDELNMKLSQSRAEAVMMHLVKKGGIDPERLEAKGYGPTRPIQDNGTPDGRAANRRVEFVILSQ